VKRLLIPPRTQCFLILVNGAIAKSPPPNPSHPHQTTPSRLRQNLQYGHAAPPFICPEQRNRATPSPRATSAIPRAPQPRHIAACSSAAQQAGSRTPAGLPADLVPAANPAFANWSAAFSSRARQAGISAQTRDIFAAQAGYLPGVVTRDGTQIQTRRTLEEYISIATSDERIAKGRAAVERLARGPEMGR